MGPFPPLNILDRASVSVVREQVREGSRIVGLGVEDAERLSIAASELAQNQIDHVGEGRMHVRPIQREGVDGLEIEASDEGPGIPDPAGAVEGTAPGRGLGFGLSSVRRMAEELDVDVRHGEGTTVTCRRFARPFRRQPEVAVVGRGMEHPSGDIAVVLRTPDRLLVAAIDGSGHGALAREVAEIAASMIQAERSACDALEAMDVALRGSRGAAATLAILRSDRTALLLGVGNVSACVVHPSGIQRYLPQAGVLGRTRARRGEPRQFTLPPQAFLVLFTDGVSSSADLGALAGRSAIQVAQRLLATHAKPHDDALVLVAR
jgi:anti-sigma regulatory factor (Ser/Thr protein kinase)